MILGSAWYFSESKFALTSFISDHPDMQLGGLPGLVLLILFAFYYIIYVLDEDMGIFKKSIPLRVIGRILAIIAPYVIFYLLLSVFTTLFSDFESEEVKIEFLKSFNYYYLTIIFLVVIPPESQTIRELFERIIRMIF